MKQGGGQEGAFEEERKAGSFQNIKNACGAFLKHQYTAV